MSRKLDWDRVNRENRVKRHGSASVSSKENTQYKTKKKGRSFIEKRRKVLARKRLQRLRRGIVRMTNELGEVTFDKLYDRCRAWKIEKEGVSVQCLVNQLKLSAKQGKIQLVGQGTKLIARTPSGKPVSTPKGKTIKKSRGTAIPAIALTQDLKPRKARENRHSSRRQIH